MTDTTTLTTPRDRVFAAYTDPELIPEWWGPRDAPVTVDQMDVRPGGAWRFVHRDANGNELGFRGTYREVTPPERIVQTFEWEGMPGHVIVESATVENLGGRTKVTATSLFHTTEERDGMLASGHGARPDRDARPPGRAAREGGVGLIGSFTPAHRGGSGPPLVCLHGSPTPGVRGSSSCPSSSAATTSSRVAVTRKAQLW